MYNTDEIRHAKIKLPKPTTHRNHPFINKDSHERLLKYVQQRLLIGKEHRDRQIERLVNIDKEFAGWMKKDYSDRQRQHKKESTGEAQAQKMNLPIAFVHIDDMMTFYATTFAPTKGMFYHTAKPDETKPSSQIVTLMNNHAIYAGYYREVLLGIFSLLKYNMGGFHVFWGSDTGPKLSTKPDGTPQLENIVRWSGNRLESLDRYNLFVDPSVAVNKLFSDGEFAGMATMRSHYWLQNKASQGIYYNCEAALRGKVDGGGHQYYRHPPKEAEMDMDESKTSGTDWGQILGATKGGYVGPGYELVEMYIRLNPNEFNLVAGNPAERDRYELWRVTVLNDSYIIDTEYMSNVHGHIPYYLGLLNDDIMGESQKSVAEILGPLQEFASFLLNTHVQANRKNLFGTTYYDPSMVDLASIPAGEVSAEVPISPAAFGKDIRSFILRDSQLLDTRQTMGDLEDVMGLISQFFPTQSMPSQIASIDRAIDSQVAAAQQGANRRQQKTARLLDESIFRNVRYAMFYNILQYQQDSEQVTDYSTNKTIEIDLTELRDTDLPFIIGQGLKAIDRQAATSQLQNLIFALIQAPQASQGIDLLGLIDYWTSMMDIDLDMNQFALAPPQAEGEGEAPVEGQVDEAGNPIQPATSAARIAGGPIYS